MQATKRDFSGQVAIVTGAGKGLGRSYALWLAAHGCSVVVNNRAAAQGPSSAQAVVDEITAAGGRAVAYEGAVETDTSGSAMVALAEEKFGRLDILICNAGVQTWSEFGALSAAQIRYVVDINLWGTLYPMMAAWPGMLARKYGRIVLTSSSAGLWGQLKSVPYCATKAAMIGITRGLVLDTPGDADIRINVISPAAYTQMSSSMLDKRWSELLSPDAVAPVVGYLCSRDCQENGMILHVGAGRVRRVRIIESVRAELDVGPFEDVLTTLTGTDEPSSSFDSGRNLMPEIFDTLPEA